jgi:ankyrin repeat protein
MRFLLLLCFAPACFGAAADDFFRAIRSNDLGALRGLIAARADVNVRGEREVTPLIYAATNGSVESVKILLEAGADVNAANAFGATALIRAVNQPEKVRLLLAKGADVNARTRQGRTALLAASYDERGEEVVKMLLAKGANPNVTDEAAGTTPLLAATFTNCASVARLLIERGLDVNARDRRGFTPLMNAASWNNVELIELLLAKGAKINAVSEPEGEAVKNGKIQLGLFTPLLLASTYGSPRAIQTLLAAGADVNARDTRGMTPLMLAVTSERQNPEIARMLLAAGADGSIRSKAGETAADWARKFNHPAMLKALDLAPDRAAAVSGEPAAGGRAETLKRAIAMLEKTNPSFLVNGGCVACHHQNTGMMAVGLARERGIPVDEAAAAEVTKAARGMWLGFSEGLMQRLDPPGGEDMLNYPLWGFAGMKYPADGVTDAMVFDLAAMQKRSGAWMRGGIARSPSSDSSISLTTMAVRALQIYGSPGRKAEFDERIKRAAAWLAEAKPVFNEESAMLLLGLKWTGAGRAKIARLAKTMLSEQRPDGGWSQNPWLASDAYATGQTLYALHEAGGLSAKDAVYQRGLAFLEKTQQADGSWRVKSRSPKFQPYFESGFPHGHDQWISSLATAWAAMALALDAGR